MIDIHLNDIAVHAVIHAATIVMMTNQVIAALALHTVTLPLWFIMIYLRPQSIHATQAQNINLDLPPPITNHRVILMFKTLIQSQANPQWPTNLNEFSIILSTMIPITTEVVTPPKIQDSCTP